MRFSRVACENTGSPSTSRCNGCSEAMNAGRHVLFLVLLVVAFGAPGAYAGFQVLESPRNALWGPVFSHGPGDRAVVALTYDDGPNPPYTDRILDVLNQEGLHATFFVVWQPPPNHPREPLPLYRTA